MIHDTIFFFLKSPSKMSRFSQNSGENDSFDDILANIEEPKILPGTSTVASPPKKSRISAEFGEDDDILANIDLPTIPAAPVQISVTKSNSILVNPKQRGNPLLKSIINIPWEFDETLLPDYLVGPTAGILYLSLRYHQLNPDYIHNRLKLLGKRLELRILLVQIDTKVNQSKKNFQIILNAND